MPNHSLSSNRISFWYILVPSQDDHIHSIGSTMILYLFVSFFSSINLFLNRKRFRYDFVVCECFMCVCEAIELGSRQFRKKNPFNTFLSFRFQFLLSFSLSILFFSLIFSFSLSLSLSFFSSIFSLYLLSFDMNLISILIYLHFFLSLLIY